MTTIRDGAVLGSHDGQVVQLVGTYVVRSIGRYTLAFTRPDGTIGTTKPTLVQIASVVAQP